ncbi:hypothetical protein D9613_001828 [Agrocybe pediades]|uniref:Anaphase-promoting complex subunit 4 n=1 Tax=Agrocybe pediades TaxID=84607 RepID=A0A8H4VVB4_9AGAR|nr:hypothetical protein D9613_001828 [Agrocybe pediades]
METNAFASLATSRLPSPARLTRNSCCPEKDLVLLISRLAGTDRLSLWSSSRGSRIWETENGNTNGSSHITGIAWSPDGQTIAVVRDPPLVSLHSLQDGHVTLSLPVNLSASSNRLTDVWWFKDEKKATKPNIPDIFKRNSIISGSSHSILKLLPLLDSLQEEADKLTATDLFAFQGSHTRNSHKSHVPPVIESWPTLSVDHMAASINDPLHNRGSADSTNLDEVDTSNIDSILMVADTEGHLFCFLDGTFPLGPVNVGTSASFSSITKHPSRPLFAGQPWFRDVEDIQTPLRPTIVEVPLLSRRAARDFAKLSSTARELMWYTIRLAKEMRETWYGSDSNTGARDLGPRWIQTLEQKQREQYGQESPNPILDLTYLLTTGRASEPLQDFLGSGEQMSERGIQKWESSVTEALIKLRDFAEKRVSSALQRLHVVLEELQGWARLPQYSEFGLQVMDLAACLDLISRGIIISSWLAAAARRELLRFREFMSWLRYEVNNMNPSIESNYARHDILEVNNYFMEGLVTSPIDNWFIGPVPQFSLADLGIPNFERGSLAQCVADAHQVATDQCQVAWQKPGPQKDVSKLDRNLEALIQDLANKCRRIFRDSSMAASRSAIVSAEPISQLDRVPQKDIQPEQSAGFAWRERTILDEAGELLRHSICQVSTAGNIMCLIRTRAGVEAGGLLAEVGVAFLDCYFPEEGQTDCDILDADFFDDESVVIVYRLRQDDKKTFIATVSYNDVGYHNTPHDSHVKNSTLEDLMRAALESWKTGQLPATKIPINRRRALSGCKTGGVTIALNGRINRRVACVLDSTGTTLESFDLEGDAEDEEDADA